jgi:hypothetical protein
MRGVVVYKWVTAKVVARSVMGVVVEQAVAERMVSEVLECVIGVVVEEGVLECACTGAKSPSHVRK